MANAARNIDQKVQAKIGKNEVKSEPAAIDNKQTTAKRGSKKK
jgi:hypothetical protein